MDRNQQKVERFDGFGLPRVPADIGKRLIGEGTKRAAKTAWLEISCSNPELQDLVTILAAELEPSDLAARERATRLTLTALEAVRRTMVHAQLSKLDAPAYDPTRAVI